jgi:hypothetical protein
MRWLIVTMFWRHLSQVLIFEKMPVILADVIVVVARRQFCLAMPVN